MTLIPTLLSFEPVAGLASPIPPSPILTRCGTPMVC